MTLAALKRRVAAARAKIVPTPAERLLHQYADACAKGEYHWLRDDPKAATEAIYTVLERLWQARAKAGKEG